MGKGMLFEASTERYMPETQKKVSVNVPWKDLRILPSPELCKVFIFSFVFYLANSLSTLPDVDIYALKFKENLMFKKTLVDTVKGVFGFFTSIYLGYFIDVYGKKTILIISLIVHLIPNSFLAANHYMSYIVLEVIGTLFSGIHLSIIAYVTALTTEKNRMQWIGISFAFMSLGGSLGIPLGSMLVITKRGTLNGCHVYYWLNSLVCMIMLIALIAYVYFYFDKLEQVPREKPDFDKGQDDASKNEPKPKMNFESFRSNLRRLCRNESYIYVLVIISTYTFAYGGF